MPAKSERQRRFMAAQMDKPMSERKAKMSKQQLQHFMFMNEDEPERKKKHKKKKESPA